MPNYNEITLNKKSEIDMKLFMNSSSNGTNTGEVLQPQEKPQKTGIKSIKDTNSVLEKTRKEQKATKMEPKEKKDQTTATDNNLLEVKTKFKDVQDLKNAVNNNNEIPPQLKVNLEMFIERLEKLEKSESFLKEYDIIANYVTWVLRFPWGKYANENLDIDAVREELNSSHYGLDAVKERFLELVAVRKLLIEGGNISTAKKSSVICMVGLQGIGKTTIARSIAKSLNRPFYRIAIGAIGNVLEIRGRNKSIEAAEPGQIYKAFIATGVRNPVILLDELDKASGEEGLRTDVMAAMLEILDPEQNTSFRDHYIDYPIDLSETMFIVSSNKTSTFSAALLDRLEIIKMPSYTDEEKKVIARDYLLPRVRATTGLKEDQLEFKDEVWQVILRPLGFDSGIRSLHRIIEGIAQKTALEIVQGKTDKVVITATNFRDYLKNY